MNINQFRPTPFYFLNTTDTGDAAQAMQQLKDAGYGGCILFNKPPTGFTQEQYLSDLWFEVTEQFVRAARELELELWINDGFDFPPGDAAGRIEAVNPDLKQLYLVKGQGVVEADWGFPAFEEPESSELFIKFVYEEYRKRLGQYFGHGIRGFFSDADNRRYNHFVRQHMGEQKYFPWSRNFAAIFTEKYGYDIQPHIDDILDEKAVTAAADYWHLAGELYQNWFRNNFAWCRKHGLKYMFHTSDTGPFSRSECPRSSIFTEGHPLELLRHCDYPGTDHELFALDGGTHFDKRYFIPQVTRGGDMERYTNSQFNVSMFDLRAKYAASAAFSNGQERVMCEAFAATNWGATPQDLRRIAAWQIIQGVNLFVPHAVHHRLFGTTKYFAPPEFLRGSLRHGVREFNDFLAKYCFIATQGEYVAETTLADPTPELWAGQQSNRQFFELCDRLNRTGISYVITDRESAIPDPVFAFDGGELAAMHRRLPDGTEFLLVANIWSDTLLSGKLSFLGQTHELELYPGEIAVIGGPWQEYRSPAPQRQIVQLPAELPVRWGTPNIVPFRQNIRWENPENIGLALLAPPGFFDGGEPVKIFDDEYRRYPVNSDHIELSSPVSYSEPLYLCGDFDVELETTGDYAQLAYQIYNLDIYEPQSEKITLKRRRNILKAASWAEQGAPFYSGTVDYELELDGTYPDAALVLPEVAGICEVYLDGKPLGKQIWPPYRFELGGLSGKHVLTIRIHNTLANQLEGYRAPGGLLAPPEIHF